MTAPQTKATQSQVDSIAQRHDQTAQGIGTLVTQTGAQVEQHINPSSSQLAQKANDAWNDLREYMTKTVQPQLTKMGEDIKKVANEQHITDQEGGASVPVPSGGGGGVGGYLNPS